MSGNRKGTLFRDYWDNLDNRPIHLKKADTILTALVSLTESVRDKRVDIFKENQAVIMVKTIKEGNAQG